MSEKQSLAGKYKELLSGLRSTDAAVRVYAAVCLTGPGVDARLVRPELEQALADPNPHVRRLAAWVLGRLSPRKRSA